MTIETDCDSNAMTLLMLVYNSHLLFWFRLTYRWREWLCNISGTTAFTSHIKGKIQL